ncbi:MAG TPA: lipopolysaccharide biosynthesis protein [Stellaceae bacterium]|nr:lipopolysaccharide biosynthesis protein [Stellaceae bacterium]
MTASGPSLKRRVASAAGWNLLATLCERLISFAVFVLVVRHIAPTAIGVVTLATVFIDMSVLISDGGLADTLIRHESPTDRTYSTAFWANLALGLGMAAVVIALAHPLALFYEMPDLETIVDAMSPLFLLSTLGIVPFARVSREFGFRTLAYRSMTSTFAGGFAAVILAFAGFGIWALVAQRLVAMLASTIMLWSVAPWIPRWQFSRAECRDLLWFGMKVTGSTICHQLTGTVVIMVLGAFCGSAAVGFYRLAQRLYDVVTQFTIMPLLRVALRAFSITLDDRERFTATYLHMTGAISMIGMGAFFGLGALAAPTVTLVFGPQWLPAAKLLTIMSISAVPMCCVVFLWPALTACGRPGQLQLFSMIEVAASAGVTALAAPWGVVAVAVAQVLRAFAMVPYAFWLLARLAGIKPAAMLGKLWAPVTAASIMAFALFLLVGQQSAAMHSLTQLAIDVPVGIGLFGLALVILVPDEVAAVRRALRSRFGARPTPSVS